MSSKTARTHETLQQNLNIFVMCVDRLYKHFLQFVVHVVWNLGHGRLWQVLCLVNILKRIMTFFFLFIIIIIVFIIVFVSTESHRVFIVI